MVIYGERVETLLPVKVGADTEPAGVPAEPVNVPVADKLWLCAVPLPTLDERPASAVTELEFADCKCVSDEPMPPLLPLLMAYSFCAVEKRLILFVVKFWL